MPTDTFFKLSTEKKKKILEAGKHEFSRVPLSEASIKNIVEEAEIARGSFYQYFEDKKDLLLYILEVNKEKIETNLEKFKNQSEGDIFKFYTIIYDTMTEKCFNNTNREIYRKIFENIKASDEDIYEKIQGKKNEKIEELKKSINVENLNIEQEEDLERIIEMLNAITINSIMKCIKNKTKEKSRKEFLRKIELIKKGIKK